MSMAESRSKNGTNYEVSTPKISKTNPKNNPFKMSNLTDKESLQTN